MQSESGPYPPLATSDLTTGFVMPISTAPSALASMRMDHTRSDERSDTALASTESAEGQGNAPIGWSLTAHASNRPLRFESRRAVRRSASSDSAHSAGPDGFTG